MSSNRSSEINELASALVKAQGEFSAIPKSSDNPFFKSKYAALPDVVMAATPILTKYGLSVSQFIGVDHEGRDILTTYLMHESGQYISQDMLLHLVPDKNGVITPQGQGSAVTYARRYSFMSVLGLVADEDDDGNLASTTYQSQAYSKPQQSAPAKKSSNSELAEKVSSAAGANDRMATENMTRMIWAVSHSGLKWDDGQMFDSVETVTGRRVEKLADLTFGEAKSVIEHLKALQEN